MTEPNQSDFGAKLRTSPRAPRVFRFSQIAASTKISAAALEALESNDLERLPGGIFTRAFVRSFASEVGLDPEEAVREFLAQSAAERMLVGSVYADDSEDHGQYLSQQRVARTALWIMPVERPDCRASDLPRVGRESRRSQTAQRQPVLNERSAEVDAGPEWCDHTAATQRR